MLAGRFPGIEREVQQRQGRLQRNFQGYSTHAECDLLGFGISSIGKVDPTYAQNVKTLEEYYERIDAGRLPVLRCVAEAERRLMAQSSPKGYLPIDGIAAYDRAVQQLVFGTDSALLATGRVATVQALGGTGLQDRPGLVGVERAVAQICHRPLPPWCPRAILLLPRALQRPAHLLSRRPMAHANIVTEAIAGTTTIRPPSAASSCSAITSAARKS